MRALTWFVLCVAVLAGLRLGRCAKSKLLSWRGPDAFLDGTLPSNRSGFTTCDDGTGMIYVFGGQDTSLGDVCEIMRYRRGSSDTRQLAVIPAREASAELKAI